jgi:hypothetical protein
LEPAGSVHKSKFFRINHRHEQIGEQCEGNEADNDVFHKLIKLDLKFPAPDGVELRGQKGGGHDGDKDQVLHKFLTAMADGAQPGRRISFTAINVADNRPEG